MTLLARFETWIFLIAIVVVNAGIVAGLGVERLPDYNFPRLIVIAGLLGLIVLAARGIGGVIELIRPLLRFFVAPKWYVLGVIWGPLIASIVLGVKMLITGTWTFDLNFTTISYLGVFLTVIFGALVGEIVWVGYAIGRLSKAWTVFTASLIVGVFWTLWWMPFVLMNTSVIPDLPLIALLINQTGVALMCGLFYYHTKSGFVVLVMQIAFNSSLLIFPVTPTGGGVGTYWAFAIVYFLAALGAYWVLGPKPAIGRAR